MIYEQTCQILPRFIHRNFLRETRLIELITLVLLFTNFKSLASLKRSLGLALAFLAFKTKDQLLGLLSLPMTQYNHKLPSYGK